MQRTPPSPRLDPTKPGSSLDPPMSVCGSSGGTHGDQKTHARQHGARRAGSASTREQRAHRPGRAEGRWRHGGDAEVTRTERLGSFLMVDGFVFCGIDVVKWCCVLCGVVVLWW